MTPMEDVLDLQLLLEDEPETGLWPCSGTQVNCEP